MNRVWLFLLIASIGVLLFIDPNAVMTGMLGASNKALTLSFELCTVYAVWVGIFTILEQTGITKFFSKILNPVINLIFGKNTLSDESKRLVSMNISANMLGMNGAATPLGIKAIASMGKNNTRATFPMVMLVAISCTSLQLLPTSIMGLMTAAGSKNASNIILPSILASFLSTAIAIILVRIVYAFKNKKDKDKS